MTDPQSIAEARPKRHFWRWLGYAAVIMLLLLVCILMFRQELVGAAARFYLNDQGIAVGSLSVSSLDTRSLVFEEVQLGTENELSASRIEVAFNAERLSVSPERVTITGLRLRLDLTGKGPMLGSLQRLIDTGQAAGESEPPGAMAFDQLPDMQLRDAKVIAETAAGPMAIDINGEFGSEADGDLLGSLSASAEADPGRLAATIETRFSNSGALAVRARIDEGQIDWQTIAVGSLTGALDLEVDAEGTPQIATDLALVDLKYQPPDAPSLKLTDGQVTAEGDPSDFSFRAALRGPGESLLLIASGALDGDANSPKLLLKTEAEVQTSGALAAYLPLAEETLAAGTATLVTEVLASLPPGSPRPAQWQYLKALPQTADAELVGEVILAEVALREGSSGISAHLPVTAKLRENALEITLSDDAALHIDSPSERNLKDLGVPDDVLPLLTSGLSVSIAAQGNQPFHLNLQPAWPPRTADITATTGFTSEQGVSASLTLEGSALMDQTGGLAEMDGSLAVEAMLERFRLGDREARGISASLRLTVALDPRGLSLALAEPGIVRLRQLSGDLPLRLNEPVRLAIERADLEPEEGTARYRYRLGSRATSVKARVEPAAGEALDIELGRTAINFGGTFDPAEGHAAEVVAEIAGTSIPAYGFNIKSLTANTRLDRDLRPVESRFSAKPVTLDAQPARISPLTIEGKLRRRGSGYDINAVAHLVDGDLKIVEAALRYDDAGTADAKLRIDPLQFAPGGLQPADVVPALAILNDVAGKASGDVGLSWPRNATAESGSLGLRNLSFSIEGVSFQNLSLDLALASLLPLSSAKNQRLTIGRIDAGVPVEDVVLRFNLDQEPEPHLIIMGGGFGLGGADWRLEPTKLDPAAARNGIVLATSNLDLATFFRLIEIEGLAGTGVLAGRIPVAFKDNSIVIEDGVLAAQGSGVLSIRSQALASALAGGGKTVELAIKALEDFRYDSLSVKLNTTTDNEAQVLLSILGSNPAVLDGQPFQFNINLESNLTSVLEALRQGYSLSDEALRRAWRLSD